MTAGHSPHHRRGGQSAASGRVLARQRGGGQRIGADGGQVSGQRFELTPGLGREGLVPPLVELLGVEPADRVMLAQHVPGTVPVLVRGADQVRIGGHHASLAPTGCCPPRWSATASAAMLANPLAPPSSAVRTQGPSAVIATVCLKRAAGPPPGVTTAQSSSSTRVSGP